MIIFELKNEILLPANEKREIFAFKSLCETVSVSAEVKRGEAELRLIGINKDGGERTYKCDKVTSSLNYVFDPVSLAVYEGFESFRIEISAGKSEATVLGISVNELESEKIEARAFSAKEKHKAPNKMLFMGNSLLLGMENSFGMCSSAPNKDYFSYVSAHVGKINPNCEFRKLHASPFEHSESLEMFESFWCGEPNTYTKAPACESFTEDLDLIILQFGDNINTEAKFETFAADKDIFIERVKKNSPNARILIVHGWYNREPVFTYIKDLCEKWGIERVDIRDLRSIENEARDMKEFLSRDGSMKPVKETWITHPGDEGMKRIAERIVEHLNIGQTE